MYAPYSDTVRIRCRHCGRFYSAEDGTPAASFRACEANPVCKAKETARWKEIESEAARRDLAMRSPVFRSIEGGRAAHLILGSLAPARRVA